MSFLNELKRRNVLRVGAAYVVTAWLIIQVVETIFPIYGFSNAAIRVVVSALAVGAVPVLFLAWAFELTPEGLMRDEDVDRSRSIATDTGKKLDRVIIVVLALGIGYFAFDKFVLSASREAAIAEAAREEGRAAAVLGAYEDRSIAVLPFVDMSPEKNQEYMSDGIAEELLNLLAQIRELRVISRSSSFSFKGENVDIPTVGEKLNASYVLEGSVRLAGEQLRITAQLIDARTDTHIWSSNYDRKLADIFRIQDEIAAAVVEELKIALLDGAPMSTPIDEETYQLVLRARYLWYRRAEGDAEKVLEIYQQVVEKLPDYAPAWAGLAGAYWVAAYWEKIDRDTGRRLAREAAERAVQLDPENANAHVRLGQAYRRAGETEPMLAEYKRAYELDPNNALVLGVLAQIQVTPTSLDEAIAMYERAEAVDPVGAIWPANKSEALLFAGRLEESEAAIKRSYDLNSNNRAYQRRLMDIAILRRNYERALEIAAQMPEDGYVAMHHSIALYHAGREAESAEELNRSYVLASEHPAGRRFRRMGNAMIYAQTARFDEAFDWLEQARADNFSRQSFEINPFLKPLYNDPRWLPMLDSYGPPPE